MEQKKNQKDVLIVRDEKTGEISVVAGLKKDGTPKTTAASGANQKDFLLFDKNSNPLDSFLDNFSGNARSRNASASTGWRRRTSSM